LDRSAITDPWNGTPSAQHVLLLVAVDADRDTGGLVLYVRAVVDLDRDRAESALGGVL
jgi:hypothetical protein